MKTKKDLTELTKALDMAGAGDTLMQPEVDKVIQSEIEKNNPLRQNLPRKTGSGKNWIQNRRTAAPDAAWVNDTETPDDSESTYTQTDFEFKTVLSEGKVTRKLIAVGRTYADIKAEEINACLDVVAAAEEYALINGNATTNAKQPDGLAQLVPAGQIVSMGDNGAALTLDKMDEAIDACFGQPNLMICSKRTRRQLNGLLQTNQRFVDRIEVEGGFRLRAYDETPIFYSQFQSDAEVKGTALNASSIYFINSEKFFVGVLTELHQELLAKTSSQFDLFDILEDVVFVMSNTKYCSRLNGIIP